MTLPATFNNNTSPTGQQLDNNYAAVAAMGIWNCTAVGTNTILLTTSANQPAVSLYTDRQRFQFVAANTSSGSVTVGVNSLTNLPLYLPDGTQAGTGDISIGLPYVVIYLSALNSGAGGFMILNSLPSSVTEPVANANIHGLVVTNNSSTPNTKIDITANMSVLVTTAGLPKFLTSVSVTIDLTTTGANGMDVGSRPTSGWVYCYIISNGSVTAGLASATSPTAGAPTFPGGYIYAAYVGAMYCDGSQNLLRTRQLGREATYVLAAATHGPQIATGTVGTYSVTDPTLSGVTVTGNSGYVPLTAGVVKVAATNTFQASNGSLLVGANTAMGGSANGPQGSLGQMWLMWLQSAANGTWLYSEVELESSQIGVASTGAGAWLGAVGWRDYWSAG